MRPCGCSSHSFPVSASEHGERLVRHSRVQNAQRCSDCVPDDDYCKWRGARGQVICPPLRPEASELIKNFPMNGDEPL